MKKIYYIYNAYAIIEIMKTRQKWAVIATICFAAGFPVAVPYSIMTSKVSAENMDFAFDIAESLAISLTTPIDDSSNSGLIGSFLRNSVLLDVYSNTSTGAGAGFTALMYAEDTTNLVHTNNDYLKTINGGQNVLVPTLSAEKTRSEFPTGMWGYSLGGQIANQGGYTDAKTYGETIAGASNSHYHAMTTSSAPITTLSNNTAGEGSRYIFFGTKPGDAQASGTYTGTVVINVVSGTVGVEIPNNPATDQDTTTNNPSYAYDQTNDRTVYTSVSTNSTAGTETITSIVSSGDTTATYADPAGETTRTAAIASSGVDLAYGLVGAAGVATAAGIAFLILAKKRDDDEDEEDE